MWKTVNYKLNSLSHATYALQTSRPLRDDEPRGFHATELFSRNNFSEKRKSKNKIFFLETNNANILEHTYFLNPRLEVLTGRDVEA